MRKEADSIIQQFIEAYSILEEAVYIPEKHRQGFIAFIKRIGKMESEPPTKIKQLQSKIYIDHEIRRLTEKIYRIAKLGKDIERT